MSHGLINQPDQATVVRPHWPLRVVVATWIRQHSDMLIIAGLIASLAYYYLVHSNLLAIPGLLVFIALTWRRLNLALCVMPLTFPFWYVPKRIYSYHFLPLSEVALLVCLVVGLIQESRRLRNGLDRARIWTRAYLLSSRVGVWLLAGAGMLFLGTTIGVVIAFYQHEALRAYRWEIVEPLLYALGLLLYVRGRFALNTLVWSFLGAATLLAALAIIQVLAIHQTYTPLAQGNQLVSYATATGGAQRATGFVLGSGNNLGAWLERDLPLALALGVSLGAGRVGRLCAWADLVVCGVALYWTGSRGAWLGAALGCAVMLCVQLRRRWLPITLGVAAMITLLWRRSVFIQALLSGHHGTGSLRLLVWLAGLKMIRDHPILGFGPDQFLYHYSNLYTTHPYWITTWNGKPTIASSQPTLAHPHNLLLDLWISGGILAVAGFALLVGACWRRTVRLWRASGADHDERAAWRASVALGLAGALAAGIVHGMVDSAYFFPDLALIFWMMVALLIDLDRLMPPLRRNIRASGKPTIRVVRTHPKGSHPSA